MGTHDMLVGGDFYFADVKIDKRIAASLVKELIGIILSDRRQIEMNVVEQYQCKVGTLEKWMIQEQTIVATEWLIGELRRIEIELLI